MSKCKRQYKSVITKRIWQSVRKLSVVLLMVACATSVLTVGGTNAGFSDLEESTDNTWTATSLDARATYIEYFSVVGMNPSQQPDSRITFSNEGGLDFRYRVRYQKTGGDDTLCQTFLLKAERDGATVYAGLLKDFDKKDFSSIPFEIPSFGSDDWDFTVTLPADAGSSLENLSCQWQFDFTAWQTNAPDATSGFSDAESVGPHTIATGEWLTPGDVVINEVMWMGSTVSDSDEWIELKNMTGSAIPLAGWKLENAGTSGGTLTIPPGKSIPAHGYFLIANYSKSSASSALNVEADWVTTSVSLRDTGNGNIVLRAPSTVVIDSALGTPDWGAGNHGSSTPFEQSMERNDIPGDGLLASSWHACVSGAANGTPYWDMTGNNFGTPKSANLSPVVLNEFVLNPVGDDDADRPEGEWIELYNIADEDIDVLGWYFTNLDGDMIAVTEDNTGSGTTVVPAKGTLVVYLEEAFLDNTADTLSLYAPGGLPLDESDDVREDTYTYEDAHLMAEGKSYARFPDGEGIWIDPVATPGEENELSALDRDVFRRLAYGTCFVGETLDRDATAEICSPLFLAYIGLLEDAGDKSIETKPLLALLEAIRLEEEAELLALVMEDGTLTPAEEILVTPVEPVEEPAEDEGDTNNDEPTPAEVAPVVPAPGTVENFEPVEESTPVEETPTPEPVVIPEEEPVVEEVPVEEIPEATIEETPAPTPVPLVAPVSETP